MHREFLIATFMSQTPNHLLEAYFEPFDWLAGFDFLHMKRAQVSTLLEDIDQQHPEARAGIEADFGDIFTLCNPEGRTIILEQLQAHQPEWLETARALPNHYALAMWLFLHSRQHDLELFDTCCTLVGLWGLPARAAHSLKGLPISAPDFSTEALENLKESILALYKRQGRGFSCDLRTFRRYQPDQYLLVLSPEDYATSDRQFRGRSLHKVARRSPFTVLYTFCPERGTLDLFAPSLTRDRSILREAFCRHALGIPAVPEQITGEVFALNRLISYHFPFHSDPQDQIERVAVVGLELMGTLKRKRTVSFKVDPSGEESVYPWIESLLGPVDLRLNFDVRSVTLRIHFQEGARGRKGPLAVTLTAPGRMSLRDKTDEPWARRILQRWKLIP